MTEIVLATNNAHKLEEFKNIFAKYNITIHSLNDLKIQVNPDENGQTFSENSLIKAKAVQQFTSLPVLADDSGIVVPALNNEPGIYSSRYAGKNATDQENRVKLVRECKNNKLTQPEAYFVCVLTLLDQELIQAEGRCYGTLLFKEKGTNGFGYDPLFYLPRYQKTMAQLSPEIKNKISHRNHAIEQLISLLKEKSYIS